MLTQKQNVSTKKAVTIYIIVSLFLFFEMALQVSPSVMASQLMQDFNITTFGLGLMSGCYFYTYTAMQIPSGALLDYFNHRMIIVLSIFVCSLGSLLFSFADNVIVAMLARLFIGVGSAFAFVSVLVVTGDLFKSKYFATLTGITQMLAALGAMSGQLPISYMVNKLGWRETMLIFSVIGFILMLAAYFSLNYSKTYHKPHVVLANENQQQTKAFLRLVLDSQTWIIALYACLLWAPMSGFASLWGVEYLIKNNQLSANQAAFVCSVMWLGLAVASPLLGMYSTYINNRKKPLIIAALIGVIAFGFVLFGHLTIIWSSICIFLSGAACAGQALSFTVVKENNKETAKATALALNNMAVVISGALVQPLIGWIMWSFRENSSQQAQYALAVVLVAYIGGLGLALFFIKEPGNENLRSYAAVNDSSGVKGS